MGRKMTTITATYRIVTPMFCSGADPKKAALRLSSFKGALRFWWRTLQHGMTVSELQKKEAAIFGSSRQSVGQSKVRMRLRWDDALPQNEDWISSWPKNRPATGSTYLGYGITESGRKGSKDYQEHRVGLPEGKTFTVECRVPGCYEQELKRSLTLVGLIGGLGNRSRRAFGSIALLNLCDQDRELQSTGDYLTAMSQCVGISTPALPEHTAFSQNSKIAFLASTSTARKAHEELGEAYRHFRGQPSNLRGRTKIPIGLPLQGIDSRRRASPLLMHIHIIGGSFVPVILFLPAKFHPEIREGDGANFFDVIDSWMNEIEGVTL